MKIIYLLLLIIFVAGCGELETSERKESDTFTSVLASREPEDFTPEFDGIRKSEVFIGIVPQIKPGIELFLEDEEEEIKDQDSTNDIVEINEETTETEELGPEFKKVGHYGSEDCRGLIFRKNFEVSFLYVFEDCKRNRTKQIVRK